MKKTDTILDRIVLAKEEHLRRRTLQKPLLEIEHELATLPPFTCSGFYEALKAPRAGPKIIAEVKKASPSAGLLRDPFMLAEINDAYQQADEVIAISVITEQDFFQGSEETLTFFATHNTNHKPLLRKDFIFDAYQIFESKLLGAQAYLLIASLFNVDELGALVDIGRSLAIEPLVEVHTKEELAMAMQTATRCIGVNSRDLRDFSITPAAHELLKVLPDKYVRVAESGIDTPVQLGAISAFADAALIGSHFMKSPDLPEAIRAMVGSRG